MARNPALGPALDEVFLGCVNQCGEDNRNVARMAALLSGLPSEVPGVTLNRLCASGLDAVAAAARAIRAGDMDLAVAGGVESMPRAPFVMGKAEHVNAHGGAIALGHPLGMSGARIAGAAVQELQRRCGRYALATMCVGVGQGAALALERV
jgi:acetyl-CoA acetyltransferase